MEDHIILHAPPIQRFKTWFNITCVAIIKNTFVDDEMWLDFFADNIDQAEANAVPLMIEKLRESGKIITKVELIRIQMLGQDNQREYLKPEDCG